MTEPKWELTLSVTDRNNIGLIQPRKNNTNSELMRVHVTNKNGEPYDLTALKVFFVTDFLDKDGLNNPVQKEATVINAEEGIFEFTLDEDCMQKVGRQEAYFEIYDYDKFLDTTQNFTYEIISSLRNVKADFTPYIETWQEAEKMLDEGTAKVLNDKAEKLELQKANVVDVNEQLRKQKQETDNKLEKKTNNDTFVAITADMQRQIESTQSGLIGDFDSLEQLNLKYPKGEKGYAIVWLNENGQKVGYTYTYKNDSWVKGNVWNGIGVPDKSVGNKKLDVVGINIADTLKINDLPPQNSNITNSSIRAYSEIINIDIGDTIGLENYPGYQFAIFKASENDSVIQGYSTHFYSKVKERIVVVLKRDDNLSMSANELDNISKKIYYANSKAITNFSVYEQETKKIVSENGPVSTFDKKYNDLLLENKVTNEYLTKNEEILVTSGEFYQEFLDEGTRKKLKNKDIIYYVIKTESNDKDLASLISFRQRNGNTIVKETKSEFVGNGIYFIKHLIDLELNQTDYQLLIDNRKGSEQIHIKDVTSSLNYIFNDFKVKRVSESLNFEKTLYVTLTGSDSNDGESELGALKTFQKAVELGASTIYAERGVYKNQSLELSDVKKLHILPLKSKIFNTETNNRIKEIVINNGEFYFRDEELIQKIIFGGNNRFKQVFIDKTLPPKTTSSRPSYNAAIWQIHEALGKDVLLEPVLSLIECQANPGSFFWDGTTLSINPKQTGYKVSGFTIHNDVSIGFNVNNIPDLNLKHVSSIFSYSQNFRIHHCQIAIEKLKSQYTVLSDGVSLDYSSGNILNSVSNYARNDGYNMHGLGDTNFWNCDGHFNGDDGISHHDGCTGSINGGVWSNNGKGGISSPTYGAGVSIDGVWSHDNAYGIYAVADDKQESKVVIKNSLITGNKIAGVRNDNYDIVLVNTIFKDNKDEFYIPKEGEPDKKGERTIY